MLNLKTKFLLRHDPKSLKIKIYSSSGTKINKNNSFLPRDFRFFQKNSFLEKFDYLYPKS